jgi:CheY-like chemotaxis protein
MLENSGFAVIGVAASGEDAIEFARERLPDLVLMDVRLRGSMSGIEAARIIQSRQPVPVIFTTAYSVDEVDEFRDRGESVLFLTKPIREGELVRTVSSALGQDAV